MYASEVPPGQIFYRGTKADLKVGDLLEAGYGSNFVDRKLSHIYFSASLEAATWGAELAQGDGRGGFTSSSRPVRSRTIRTSPTRSFRAT